MRELKFRAWYSGDNPPLLFEQTMRDDYLWFIHKYTNGEIPYRFNDIFVDGDWIIEQYTGLKDKNGKEIYEGDILEVSMLIECDDGILEDGIAVVEFDGFMWTLKNKKQWQILSQFGSGLLEIIGNIHENPELLER